jgi:hypothetical protein
MYSLTQRADGRFIIRHPQHPGLAWSQEAEDWVLSALADDPRGFSIVTFASEDAADQYATDHNLYPRRD